MVSPQQILQKARSLYKQVCDAYIAGEEIFPLQLRLNRQPVKDTAEHIRALRALADGAKPSRAKSYNLEVDLLPSGTQGQRKVRRIYFERQEDFLGFTGKEEEFAQLMQDWALIKAANPALAKALQGKAAYVIRRAGHWPALLDSLAWMQEHDAAAWYVRDVPVADSKFIERQAGTLVDLLACIAPHKLLASDLVPLERLGFKREQKPIWVRNLDDNLFLSGIGLAETGILPSELARIYAPGLRVLIVENQTTFRSLPALPYTLGLWGEGFAVSRIRDIDWLKAVPVYYWGDLDAHGLMILAQARELLPHLKAILMDMRTAQDHQLAAAPRGRAPAEPPTSLNDEEKSLYRYLQPQNLRLEQERISTSYRDEMLRQFWQ